MTQGRDLVGPAHIHAAWGGRAARGGGADAVEWTDLITSSNIEDGRAGRALKSDEACRELDNSGVRVTFGGSAAFGSPAAFGKSSASA